MGITIIKDNNIFGSIWGPPYLGKLPAVAMLAHFEGRRCYSDQYSGSKYFGNDLSPRRFYSEPQVQLPSNLQEDLRVTKHSGTLVRGHINMPIVFGGLYWSPLIYITKKLLFGLFGCGALRSYCSEIVVLGFRSLGC